MSERNDFNINLGDTIYSDSEVGGAPVARTVAEKWGKYQLGLALPALQKLRASAATRSPHWRHVQYAQVTVTVTARRLTVAMKDAKGQPVREATGVACAPLVLTAR